MAGVVSDVALRAIGRERMLMVGTSPLLMDIAQYVAQHPETGLEVAGFVSDPEARGWIFPAASYWGPYRSFLKS